MVLALTWQKLVTALAFAVMLIVGIFAIIDGSISAEDIWARRNQIVTILMILLGLLGIPQVFGVVHKLTFAKFWMFPLLDGEWTAQLCSNWPRIRKTYESAKAGGPPFDAMIDPLSEADEAERHVEADVTIRSSLFLVSMTLRPKNSNRVSRTRFIRPLWRSPDLPELSYVFEQEDLDPVARTDEPEHFGAGVIKYHTDRDEIAGKYWNDRREDAGLNTAGTIRMTRVPR